MNISIVDVETGQSMPSPTLYTDVVSMGVPAGSVGHASIISIPSGIIVLPLSGS